VKTGFGDNVDFDGWVASRVVDRTSLNLSDCHVRGFLLRGKELAMKARINREGGLEMEELVSPS
jgi:hypothetical protein